MRWVVIGKKFIRERYDYLNQCLQEYSPGAQVEYLEGDERDVLGAVKNAMKEYDQLRVERPYRETIIESLEVMTSQAMVQRTADVFVQEHGSWWPRSTLYKGIVRLTAHRLKNLDLRSAVFIVGTGASARAAVAAFIKLGFSQINITDRFTEKGLALVADLKKVYLGVNIEFTPADALTQLPGNHQIIFNTTPYTPGNELLEELYYFNYMQENGIVMDMGLVPVTPPLLLEAQSVNAQTVDGCELASWSDVVWCEMCLGIKLDFDKYSRGLRAEMLKLDR